MWLQTDGFPIWQCLDPMFSSAGAFQIVMRRALYQAAQVDDILKPLIRRRGFDSVPCFPTQADRKRERERYIYI